MKRVLTIALGAIVYVGVIALLGFYPASVLFLFCMSMILSDSGVTTAKKAMASAVFTAVLCVAVWFGFVFFTRRSNAAKRALLARYALSSRHSCQAQLLNAHGRSYFSQRCPQLS